MDVNQLAEQVAATLDDQADVKVKGDVIHVVFANGHTAFVQIIGHTTLTRTSCGYSSAVTLSHSEPKTLARDTAAFLCHLAIYAS